MPRSILTESILMDSALTYDGAPATQFTGLDHLKGRTVVALADGNVIKDLVVHEITSGVWGVVLVAAASVVHIGLPNRAKLRTLKLEYDAQGTVQGRKKKLAKVYVRLDNTRGAWVGPDTTRLVEMKFRSDEDYGAATNLFSGDKSVIIEPRWGTEGELCIEQGDPVPITILAIIPEIETSATG